MIPIGMLSLEKQMVFLSLLLLVLFGEVILLVYKGSHLLPLRKLFTDGVLAFARLILFDLLVQGSKQSKWIFSVPAEILAALIFSLSLYIAAGFLRERKRIKSELSLYNNNYNK